MHCLNDCENAVLDFFLAAGDATTCLYKCAEELSEKFQLVDVVASCGVLQAIGLVKKCGDTTEYAKLSPAAIGDVQKGYFTKVGHTSPELVLLQKKLLGIEAERVRLAEVSLAREGSGGLVSKK